MPEWPRSTLEVLREPLESGRVTVSRAGHQSEFPARFQLIAAMNPCPCGWHGDPSGRCHCSFEQVARYRGRVSGPLLDRIDLSIHVPRVKVDQLRHDAPAGESSAAVRARVAAARRRQHARAGVPNARLDSGGVIEHCGLAAGDLALLERASDRLQLSARGHQRILRVARTIADLAASECIATPHLAEAIALRAQS